MTGSSGIFFFLAKSSIFFLVYNISTGLVRLCFAFSVRVRAYTRVYGLGVIGICIHTCIRTHIALRAGGDVHTDSDPKA